MDEIRREDALEVTEAVRQFAALPPDKQRDALLIISGMQVCESLQAGRESA